VPVHWWQAVDFIRMNFAVVRGHDPWADRILSRPWALSSLLEYVYMFIKLPVSDAYFIVASGVRAGTLWTIHRSGLLYILNLGLLPRFRARGIGVEAARFVEDHGLRQGCKAAAASVAVSNEPVQQLVRLFDGGPLGLSTTRLTLSTASSLPSAPPGTEIKEVGRSEAIRAWRRWRLHGVEQVSGRSGVEVAASLLDAFGWLVSLPRGRYLTVHQEGQEIGFAFVRRRKGELNIGLFPSVRFWPGPQTAVLVAALASYVGSPVRYLTLTLAHADALAASSPFGFERRRERERQFVFWLAESRAVSVETRPVDEQAIPRR